MSFQEEMSGLLRQRVVQLGALALLLIGVGALSFFLKFSVLDLDVWWHLKVGDWIRANHGVPHNGIFSRSAGNLPWVAYSWGYEVVLSLFHSGFGLLGVGIYGTLLTVGLAAAIFWMLRRLSGSFWWAFLLSLAAYLPVLLSMMPRPVFFTIMLWCLLFTLLLEANRTGRVQLLYWLPAIFLLWANLHIQFVYGLLTLGIFVAVNIAQHLLARVKTYPEYLLPPMLPAGHLLAILGACVVATCIDPYGIQLYRVILEYGQAKFAYSRIQELQAITFRAPEHYIQLVLTAAGFFVLGRQQKLDPFKLVFLTICLIIAYRTARDSWFICLPAVAFIADSRPPEKERERPESALEWAAVAAAVCVGLVLVAPSLHFNERDLQRTVAANFPVDAVNFLRRNPVPGPLYNDQNWGGFLTWYMPDKPVVIDGRNDLYGDKLLEYFDKLESGDPSYATDPFLNDSGVVLLYRKIPLARRLQNDPRFSLIYEDRLAVVFARQ